MDRITRFIQQSTIMVGRLNIALSVNDRSEIPKLNVCVSKILMLKPTPM